MGHTEHPWKHATLGDYVNIQTGFPFKSQHYTDDPSGIRLLRGDNIVQGKLRWDGVKRWGSDDGALEKYFLRADDIVLAMDRPWIEAGLKYAWITEQDLPCLLVQRVSRLRGINGLLTRYIRYTIGHHSFTDYVKGIWTGVAVPHISESQIRAFRFLLPPTGIQERILSILSAYDDLIENNTRRIKILEEMAQMIYREWFVNFSFPGHNKVKMVESEMGPIPELWSVDSLGSVAEVNELSIKTNDSPERIIYIDIASVSTALIDKKEPMQFSEAPSRARRIVRHGDVIWSTVRPNRRSFAMILSPEPHLVVSTGFAVLTAKKVPYSYLYFATTTDSFAEYLTNHATGAAYPAVNSKDFQNARLLLPPKPLLDHFHSVAADMLIFQHNLHLKNANLRTTRDLLLPKLISGEVSVENLEVAATA